MQWAEKRNEKMERQKAMKEIQELEGLTFTPRIKTMVSESNISRDDAISSKSATMPIPSNFTIPLDSGESRSSFKAVPGMLKYLQKQYKGMV